MRGGNWIRKDKVAFIGNEINDTAAMSYVGLAVACVFRTGLPNVTVTKILGVLLNFMKYSANSIQMSENKIIPGDNISSRHAMSLGVPFVWL
jgi:hypothetical protein